MNIFIIILIISCITLFSFAFWKLISKNLKVRKKSEGNRFVPINQDFNENTTKLPGNKITYGSGDKEIISIEIIDKPVNTIGGNDQLTPIPLSSISEALGNLAEPLIKMTPSTLVATAVSNNQIMEIVINGKMLAAADGDGFRAIAKANEGFEHGRLYKPSNLQNLASAAAIWQIASVIVAQKNLADINATLQRVESKIDEVQSLLEDSRSAIIDDVIEQTISAKIEIEKGDFSKLTRHKLEDYNSDLSRISKALSRQINRQFEVNLKRDTVGCQGEYESAIEKHKKMIELINELLLCNEVRLANWYLCSAYPDDRKTLGDRLEKIKKDISTSEEIIIKAKNISESDINRIAAKMTFNSTIAKRKLALASTIEASQSSFSQSIERQNNIISSVKKISIDLESEHRIILETRDGRPIAAYLH